MTVSDYSLTANSNGRISGINIAENCPPSMINNALRQMMADIRLLANDAGWFSFGSGDGTTRPSLERASNGDILLGGGDLTSSYTANRRIRVKQLPNSYYYGTIFGATASASGITTVKVGWDRGVIPSGPYDSIALGVDPNSCSGSTVFPPGMVLYIAATVVPLGFLAANGQSVERAAYPALFNAIGITFGSTAATNFHLPDLRGEFIRGLDSGRNIDLLRSLGSLQESQNRAHSHSFNGYGISTSSHDSNSKLYGLPSGPLAVDNLQVTGNRSLGNDGLGAINRDGGDEARPRNIALLAVIKA